MTKKQSQNQSLWKLRQFCSDPPQGMISHWWFNGLVNAFPLQFLFYSQFSKNFSGTKKNAKENIAKRFEHKINKLLEFPISEHEITAIENMWDKLDKMIQENNSVANN